MKFSVEFSASSLKFLKENSLVEGFVVEKLTVAIRKFKGEDVNIDIKKLKGEWEGFYRIRVGKVRIIVEFQFEQNRIFVEEIDWRGNIYK